MKQQNAKGRGWIEDKITSTESLALEYINNTACNKYKNLSKIVIRNDKLLLVKD